MLDGHSLIVEHVSEIAVSPEDVFDALGDAAILGECLTPLERIRITAETGGRIGFRDPDLGVVIGRVGEYERGVRMTWRMIQNWPRVLSFDCSANGGGCRVNVMQSDFAALRGDGPDINDLFAERWDRWMAGLKRRLES